MYRSGIKPWRSSEFKPQLTEQAHRKHIRAEEGSQDEKRTSEEKA